MRRRIRLLAAGLTAALAHATAGAQVFAPASVYYGTNGWTYVPPSGPSYATYGLAGNAFQPVYPSYMPYSPVVGVQYQGTGYPVPAITFANPHNGAPVTLSQSDTGPLPGQDLYYNAGYPGHSAPRPYYSYNQSALSPNLPGVPSYAPVTSGLQSGQANFVSPTATGLPPAGSGLLPGLGSPAFVGSPPTPGFVGAPGGAGLP